MEKRAPSQVHPVVAVVLFLLAASPILIYFLLPGAATPARPKLPAVRPPEPTAAAPDVPTEPVKLTEFPIRTGRILDISGNPALAGFTATRLSVDIDHLPAAEAFARFSEALPVPLSVPPMVTRVEAWKTRGVTLHAKDAPLWEALFEMWAQTGIRYNEVSKEKIVMAGSNANVTTWCVAGPFAVALRQLTGTRSLAVDAEPDYQLAMEVYAEPSVSVLGFPSTVDFTDFTDDLGRSFVHPGRPSSAVQSTTMYVASLTVPFKSPATAAGSPRVSAKRIALMKGTLPLLFGTAFEKVQTVSPTDAPTQSIGGVKIEIMPFTVTPAQPNTPIVQRTRVQIRFTQEEMPADQWNQLYNALRTLRPECFTENQERIPLTAFISGNTTPNRILNLTFEARPGNGQGEPHHLVLQMPTAWRTVPVPFEFTDVPLP